jgi:hypothetical protein
MVFEQYRSMFMTAPTIDELVALDMSTLVDMLSYHTTLHFRLRKEDGMTNTAIINKNSIINIQLAIELKRKAESNGTNTGADTTFIPDNPSVA